MPTLSTGKNAEVMYEKAIETYESQDMMHYLVNVSTPDAAKMQNAGDVLWRSRRQFRPVIEGWDLAGKETGIIKETYPSALRAPLNDFVKQRVDDLRDKSFWEESGEESGYKLASRLNTEIAENIAYLGSLFYVKATDSGYDLISEAQVIMNERQTNKSGTRYFLLNDRDCQLVSKDLAGRQTLQGRPEETWKTGQIGKNVAEFDVFTASFLPPYPSSSPVADPTVAANYSFKPEGGSVNPTTRVVTNVDYREAIITVDSTANIDPGSKFVIENPGVSVIKPLGLDTKNLADTSMTFTVVEVPSATTIKFYPKPIAGDDSALSDLQKSYINCDKYIRVSAKVVFYDYPNSKLNLFWDKQAVEVLNGPIPAELYKEFEGGKVLEHKMKNGVSMYMVYDGNIEDMTFRYRLFTRYGIVVNDPLNCGCCIKQPAA